MVFAVDISLLVVFKFYTALTDKQLTREPRVREVESSDSKGRPNLTQRCKRFATASITSGVTRGLSQGRGASLERGTLILTQV